MVDEVLPIVSQVGFPIAAYLLMFWLVKSTMQKNTEAVNSLKESIDKLCERRVKR